LKPDLDRRVSRAGEQRILQQAGEVFLKASLSTPERKCIGAPE